MAGPSTIMIIRHAEKPTIKHEPPFGVTADGEQDWESLTVRGWERAGALGGLFAPARGLLQDPHLSVPRTIYASKASDTGGLSGSKSNRPEQTVAVLAAVLGVIPNRTFGKGDEASLAADVLIQNGPVLISWQHESIDEIVGHLTANATVSPPPPAHWPDDRFDMVWILTPPDPGSTVWGFVQVPQRLLEGDEASTF